jgi:hypothetical protein
MASQFEGNLVLEGSGQYRNPRHFDILVEDIRERVLELLMNDQEKIWDYFDGFGGRYELIEMILGYMRPKDLRDLLKDIEDMDEEMSDKDPASGPT